MLVWENGVCFNFVFWSCKFYIYLKVVWDDIVGLFVRGKIIIVFFNKSVDDYCLVIFFFK